MSTYLETSAAVKLLLDEDESAALAEHLDRLADEGATLVSSLLLETELRRVAVRTDLPQPDVSAVLTRLDLHEPDRALFHTAGVLPGRHLRSLDALHVAAALRAQCDEFVTYDERRAEAAAAVGLVVTSPGPVTSTSS